MKTNLKNWLTVVENGTGRVLGVYTPEQRAAAEAQRDELEARTGKPHPIHDAWRHSKPRVGAVEDWCVYCNAPVRRGGLDIEGLPAHKNCHREACK